MRLVNFDAGDGPQAGKLVDDGVVPFPTLAKAASEA